MSVFIIAELGSVHDGSLGNALALIDACAAAGANAVKLQDHLGERVKGVPPWALNLGESRDEYLKRTQFTDEAWRRIRERCTQRGVELVVSPFSVAAVERLERCANVDAYKVASGQVTNLGMLDAIRRTGKHTILSSGMTTHEELATALLALLGAWAVLQCTSEYPCAPERVGLQNVAAFRDWLGGGVRVGLSDHTLGMAASLAAITLGATVIERHVCFDRRGYGTDCRHSMTLDEFAAFVAEVRQLEVMLASPVDKDSIAATPEMQETRRAFLE